MGTPVTEKQDFPMLVGGEWVRTEVRRTIRLPYDGTPVGETYEADASTTERAVTAAQAGASAMAGLTPYERAELLDRMRRLLERDAAEFARLVCYETGKPIREARIEVDRGQQTLLASADAARNLRGEVIPMEAAPIGKGRWGMTVREPLGIVCAITPFNFPLNLALHKIGPALAAGNSVVHKPSGNTPLSALRLGRLIQEAGAPAGAYNVVTGPGGTVGGQLIGDPRVAMITFTGSVPVGEQIRAQTGLRRVTLELGSNSSLILEPDCDLDTMIPRCVTGSFSHSGQVCISVQNIYIHEDIEEIFTERFIAATQKLKIGHPLEESYRYFLDDYRGRSRAGGRVDRARTPPRSARVDGRQTAKRHTRACHSRCCLTRTGGVLQGGFWPGCRLAHLPAFTGRHRRRECGRVWFAGRHLHARYWQGVSSRPPIAGGRRHRE